jgi:hypothetical protein
MTCLEVAFFVHFYDNVNILLVALATCFSSDLCKVTVSCGTINLGSRCYLLKDISGVHASYQSTTLELPVRISLLLNIFNASFFMPIS